MVKAMRYDLLVLVGITLSLCTGCIAPESLEVERGENPPIHMSFEAPTLDRSEDGGATFNLKQHLQEGPSLVLWVGAGCSGCHDWTELIRATMDEGGFNDTNISVVSVHRWALFETTDDVMETFADDTNTSYYTPWTLVVPDVDTPTYEFETGLNTGYPLYEAYGNPSTPTLQLIDESGAIVWQSKTYWAEETVLDEALMFFD